MNNQRGHNASGEAGDRLDYRGRKGNRGLAALDGGVDSGHAEWPGAERRRRRRIGGSGEIMLAFLEMEEVVKRVAIGMCSR